MTTEFHIGRWRVDVGALTLHGPDGVTTLEPRTMALLEYFCLHPGQTLSKDDLLTAVWGSEHFTDSAVTRAISILRGKLGDTRDESTFILTVPRRGYRFIAAVKSVRAEQSHPTTTTDSAVLENSPRRWQRATGVALLVVVAIAVAGLVTNQSLPPSHGELAHLQSIAVAPFDVDVHDTETHFPLDGLHVDVAAQLARLQHPRVFLLSEEQGDGALAQDTSHSADALLTAKGHVVDERLTLELRLFGLQSRELVWTSEYVMNRGDVFAARQQMIADLASLTRAGFDRWESRLASQSVNSEAYEAYLEGLWLWRQRSFDSLAEGQQRFEKAIHMDPGFADAHAGLALSHLARVSYGRENQATGYATAAAAADSALALDPENPWALTARGEVAMQRDWNFDSAIRWFTKAIIASPGAVDARQYLAEVYSITGRHQDALRTIEEAIALRPDSQLLRGIKGMIHTAAGEYAGAIATMEALDRSKPAFGWHHWYWSYAHLRRGEDQRAMELRIREFEARFSAETVAALKDAVAAGGPSAFWKWQVERLITVEPRSAAVAALLAEAYMETGDIENGMQALHQSVQLRGEGFAMLRISPSFDAVRKTMEYQQILSESGLQPVDHPFKMAARAPST